jgi:hypothetical protein
VVDPLTPTSESTAREEDFPREDSPPPDSLPDLSDELPGAALFDIADDDEYEVGQILGHVPRDDHPGEWLYIIRWVGYGPEDDTHEPEEHLINAPEILQEYKERNGL